MMKLAIAMLVVISLSGCADSDWVYRNMYEGLKTREAILHPAAQNKPVEISMSYDRYEAERKKLTGNSDQK